MVRKTLNEARRYWEAGRDIVGHYHLRKQYCYVTITKTQGKFSLIRYFETSSGGLWHTSCDLQEVTAETVFHRLAYLMDAQKLEPEE